MKKSLAYYFEKYIGLISGSISGYYCFLHFSQYNFIIEKDFTDRLITIGTTLFGFLLTVLTLIIQSTSEVIAEMKKHGSYIRLIKYNKTVILLSGIVVFISLFSVFIKDQINPIIMKTIGSINMGLFIWDIINTLIFVILFYKIITIPENSI